MKPKVYLETTVVSYFTAKPSRDIITAAHQQITQEWWENRRADFDLFISELVEQEASAGDEDAVQRRLKALDGLPALQVNQAAVDLARILVNENALPEKATGDALHVAIATMNAMDYLMTWNMRHLANATIRNAITIICRAHGYEPPVICTPEELLEV
ncbi:MAG: type II toxin-antitoxin system VapC family toxin [Anaerolineales bacterium]|nr:type II toxin-antitoxin system VapC family toxin [Anaerolineales bacterium]